MTIGSVRCAASEACAVEAVPKQEKVRVAGKAVRAKVVVPPFLGAGGKGSVKLRFGVGALQRLAGHTATFTARVVVRGSGKQVSHNFKARLSRPAAPATAVRRRWRRLRRDQRRRRQRLAERGRVPLRTDLR